jgi:hypothetical protein
MSFDELHRVGKYSRTSSICSLGRTVYVRRIRENHECTEHAMQPWTVDSARHEVDTERCVNATASQSSLKICRDRQTATTREVLGARRVR